MKTKKIATAFVIIGLWSQVILAQVQWNVSNLGIQWRCPSYTNVGILQVSLSNVPSEVTLSQLTLRSGNTSDQDVLGVKLYRDNGDGYFEVGTDPVASGSVPFSGQCVTFSGLAIPPEDNGELVAYIAYDIASVGTSSNFHHLDGYFEIGDIVLSDGTFNPAVENPEGYVTMINEVIVEIAPPSNFFNLVGSQKTIEISVKQIVGLKGAHLICDYDASRLEVIQVQKGSIWPTSGFTFFAHREVEQSIEIDLAYLNGTVSGTGVLASIIFAVKKPGNVHLNLSTVDLRDNQNQTFPFSVQAQHGYSHFILGDFCGRTADPDGKVDFEDLVKFASAYNLAAGQAGWSDIYDIGPTNSGNTDGTPLADGQVSFQDLSIFALNYGNRANESLPKVSTIQGIASTSLNLIRNTEFIGNEKLVKYKLILDGNKEYIRGFETCMRYDPISMKLVGVNKIYNSEFNAFFKTFSDDEKGTINLSWAVLGKCENLGQGVKIAELTFEILATKDRPIEFQWVDVRNSENRKLTCSCGIDDLKCKENTQVAPEAMFLSANYPNPFNSTTHFNIELAKSSNVQVGIYNLLGQEIKSLYSDLLAAGSHSFTWDGMDKNGSEMSTGIYLYVLSSGSNREIRKLTLLK